MWTECERLLPHVLIYTISTEQSPADLELAHVLRKAADYLSARAQYAEAEPAIYAGIAHPGSCVGA